MPRRSTPTVADALDMYMASRSDLAANTALNDRSVLNQFVNGVGKDGKDKQLVYLTPDQIERHFITYVGPRNESPASFNKVRQRVWSFLAYTARHGWTASPEQ